MSGTPFCVRTGNKSDDQKKKNFEEDLQRDTVGKINKVIDEFEMEEPPGGTYVTHVVVETGVVSETGGEDETETS